MKNRILLVTILALAAAGCAKMEKKEEITAPAPQMEAPKMEAAPTPAAPAPATSDIRKSTYDSCIERNKDNALYCSCYADEYANRYKDKSAGGEVSVQDKGHIAVQSALACRQHMKKS